jgi:hypothetical protein
VRTGIATAAGTPVDNVELQLKTRRSVEYVATVYAKDAAAAAVKTKLADSTAVKAALTAAVSIFYSQAICCVLLFCYCTVSSV